MPTKQAKAPISAHPLFPAVVALWFAALFGLGSGVLPNVLFERVIGITHLSALIPSATPPLGATFRILISLTFALAGAVLGFILARCLSAAQYEERPASVVSQITPKADKPAAAPRKDDGKRRPISVKEELGNTRLDPVFDEGDARSLPIPPRLGTRRRSLALAEEERKSDFFTDPPVAQPDAPLPVPEAAVQEPPMEHPLDLTSFAAPEPDPVPEPPLEPVEDPVHFAHAEPRIESESIVDRGLHGLRNRSPFAKPLGDEGQPPAAIEPPVFAAPAIETAAAYEPLPFDPPPAEPTPAAEPARAASPLLPTDPLVDLDDLGMVQLAERLASSLRNRLARPAATPALVAGLKADFGIETAAPVAPAEIAPGSAIFGGAAFEPVAPDAPPPPPVIPAALRPLPLDLDDEDDDAALASLSLPLGAFSPAAPAAEDEDEFDDIGETEENYSSLLAMKTPFNAPAEFVRIDEPEPEEGSAQPAVVFPGESPAAEAAPEARPFDAPAAPAVAASRPDADETDRALRSALATLQRMSGAA